MQNTISLSQFPNIEKAIIEYCKVQNEKITFTIKAYSQHETTQCATLILHSNQQIPKTIVGGIYINPQIEDELQEIVKQIDSQNYRKKSFLVFVVDLELKKAQKEVNILKL